MIVTPLGPVYIYAATLHRVLDGDTAELNVDLGFRVWGRLLIRLRGYSCPELREIGGPEAAVAARTWMSGRKLLIQSYKDQQTFAQWVADVWVFTDHWEALGDLLVSGGHATVTAA